MLDVRRGQPAGMAIAGLVAVGLLVVALMAATRAAPHATDRGVGGDRTAYGKTIALPDALALIDDCGCPGLPPVGDAGQSHVVRAWEKDADFGFVFTDGTDLSYEATSETPEEFVGRIEASIADPDESGPVGRLLPLRGTQAWVKELDEHGPAFVEWVEAGTELTLIGGAGRDLSVVLEAARGLISNTPLP